MCIRDRSGTDASLFTIDADTGEVSFINAPDYENPEDAGANNVYDVIVTASDGTNSVDQSVAITVTNLNDNSPVFTSGTTASIAENTTTVVYTATATDPDDGTGLGNGLTGTNADTGGSTSLTYSLSGTDAALFTINGITGEVSFVNAPDFENPSDAGGDNVYDIIVTASDGTNSTDQSVAITVTDLNDNNPVFTSGTTASVAENETSAYTATVTDADAGTSLTYSLSGTDASLFTIDADTGEVSFILSLIYI